MNDQFGDFFQTHRDRLSHIDAMWSDPKVQCYDDKDIPLAVKEGREKALFLAGPTSRRQIPYFMWRAEAVHLLRLSGYAGWIYVPEPRGVAYAEDFTASKPIYTWESDRLLTADDAVFWIPRDDGELLGINTPLENGILMSMTSAAASNRRLWVGWPENTKRGVGLTEHYMVHFKIGVPFYDLAELCFEVAQHQ